MNENNMLKKDHKLRLKIFDLLVQMKNDNLGKTYIIKKLNADFFINEGTLYQWYSGKLPYGRKGKIVVNPELFYVLGALLGDGCLYNWRITSYYTILIGDERFTSKYACMISQCTNNNAKAYIDRSKNVWFVRCNNFELYQLFKKVREDIEYLRIIMSNNKKFALAFMEGFFDAEGCVKIIKEEVRITPKICLDVTNTDKRYLEIIKDILWSQLKIEARYSIQKPYLGADGFQRKIAYHLRIYKKEYIRKFLENITTTKLKKEKIKYVENWLNNGK